MTMAAISDIRQLLIPNWIPVLLSLVFVASWVAGHDEHIWTRLIASLVLGTMLTVAFAAGQCGGGDVKLCTALALFIHPNDWGILLLGVSVGVLLVVSLRFVLGQLSYVFPRARLWPLFRGEGGLPPAPALLFGVLILIITVR